IARAIELLEKLQESGDVPGHKLQSLKKVLQSEFCTAIRETRRLHGGAGAVMRDSCSLASALCITDLFAAPISKQLTSAMSGGPLTRERRAER
ncbi:hypothetical protein CRUP_016585, partial [Coryphaenoides rupestris]